MKQYKESEKVSFLECLESCRNFSHELIDDARLSYMNPADVFKCPSCGFVGCVVEYHQNGDGFWDLDIPGDFEPQYCPECGEKMVIE